MNKYKGISHVSKNTGEIEVPVINSVKRRSKRNFPVGKERMPIEVVYGFAQLKRGAALANHELGKLSDAKMQSAAFNLRGDEHFTVVSATAVRKVT